MNDIILKILLVVKYSNTYTQKEVLKMLPNVSYNEFKVAIQIGVNKGLFITYSNKIFMLTRKGQKVYQTCESLIDIAE
jgi:predicted transcriptional regulator